MRLFSGSLTNNRVTPGDEGGSRKLRRYLPCSQSWPPAPCAPLTHLRDLHAPDAKGTTVSPRESSGAPWHVSPLLWPRCGLSVRQQVQPGPGKGTTGPRGDDQSRRHEHLKEFAASQFDVKGRSRGQHKEITNSLLTWCGTRCAFWIHFGLFTACSAYKVTLLPSRMKSYFCSTVSPILSLWTQGEGTAWTEVKQPGQRSNILPFPHPWPCPVCLAPCALTPLPAQTHRTTPSPGHTHGAGRPQASADPL
ncbi:uncharacterized protein LOC116662571 isoform X1 [Camelus ferus]|uniref:Uncharacterized protein LOC116662571 isoform X1 n=1 Tax=Camelus ferus TaxID=419612 RepID=A0A8B8SRV9_CAMFR|nr:uncharacterized protein LOC116662571 isoform X1 [Camelus ferus]XP_032332202.1 uncharacterized protein LOC116662571 isoform X1 [Camelus ferus]XP_032332203.1 uncharacterized protein LOC116662571 isoform X1 [Camelus ferus]